MKFKTTVRDHFIVISRPNIKKKKKDKKLAILSLNEDVIKQLKL